MTPVSDPDDPGTPNTPASSVSSATATGTPVTPTTRASSVHNDSDTSTSAEDRRAVEKMLGCAASPVTPTPNRLRDSTATLGDATPVRAASRVRGASVIDLTSARNTDGSLNELLARTFAATGPVRAASARPSPRPASTPASDDGTVTSRREGSRAPSDVAVYASGQVGRAASVVPKAEDTPPPSMAATDDVCIIGVVKAEETESSLSATCGDNNLMPPPAMVGARANTPAATRTASPHVSSNTSARQSTPRGTRTWSPAPRRRTSGPEAMNRIRASTPVRTPNRATPRPSTPSRTLNRADSRPPTPSRPSTPTPTPMRSPISPCTPTPAPQIAIAALQRNTNDAIPYTPTRQRYASVPVTLHPGFAALNSNGGGAVRRGRRRDAIEDVEMMDVEQDGRDGGAGGPGTGGDVDLCRGENSTTTRPRAGTRTTAAPTTHISSTSESSDSEPDVVITSTTSAARPSASSSSTTSTSADTRNGNSRRSGRKIYSTEWTLDFSGAINSHCSRRISTTEEPTYVRTQLMMADIRRAIARYYPDVPIDPRDSTA